MGLQSCYSSTFLHTDRHESAGFFLSIIFSHPKTPASCCPTPPIGISPQSAASHTGLSLIWMRPGPLQLTCGLQQSSGLVFKMGLHCNDTHTKKVKWYRTRENCVGQSVWFDFKYVSHLIHAFNTRSKWEAHYELFFWNKYLLIIVVSHHNTLCAPL